MGQAIILIVRMDTSAIGHGTAATAVESLRRIYRLFTNIIVSVLLSVTPGDN